MGSRMSTARVAMSATLLLCGRGLSNQTAGAAESAEEPQAVVKATQNSSNVSTFGGFRGIKWGNRLPDRKDMYISARQMDYLGGAIPEISPRVPNRHVITYERVGDKKRIGELTVRGRIGYSAFDGKLYAVAVADIDDPKRLLGLLKQRFGEPKTELPLRSMVSYEWEGRDTDGSTVAILMLHRLAPDGQAAKETGDLLMTHVPLSNQANLTTKAEQKEGATKGTESVDDDF